MVRLENIRPNPYQPTTRLNIPVEVAEKFGASIKEHGLLQTPVGRWGGGLGCVEMADGWMRYNGFKWLDSQDFSGFDSLPVRVLQLSDHQMADMIIEANTVRQDLNPIELANLYKKYLVDFKVPQAELARAHNITQGELSNTIRLLDLPEGIQDKIISREISETHGRQLLRLNYAPVFQSQALTETLKEGYSVNQLSNEIARKIYSNSESLDPDDYPKPVFDVTGCEKCEFRQKIGSPYYASKKTWRCLNKPCWVEKTEQAKKDEVTKAVAEMAAAKAAAGDKSKVSDKPLDLLKLGWRDYQEFDSYSGPKIDKTECKTCTRRGLGKGYGGDIRQVCLDTTCFKKKEKEAQAIVDAKNRDIEKKLTERIRAACLKEDSNGYQTVFELVNDYLAGKGRKDTKEKAGKILGDAGNRIQETIAFILTLERFEGSKGRFLKMLGGVDGDFAEIDAALKKYADKQCKGCKSAVGYTGLLTPCPRLLENYEHNYSCSYATKQGNPEVES